MGPTTLPVKVGLLDKSCNKILVFTKSVTNPAEPSSNPTMLVTEEKFQLPIGCSKDAAPLNMFGIETTLPIFHPLISRLNAVAPANIEDMLVTADTFHPPIAELKVVAPANIDDILVTAPVFHPLISELNKEHPKNMEDILVTPDTSHAPMFPNSLHPPPILSPPLIPFPPPLTVALL